jgi:hypothetical protein
MAEFALPERTPADKATCRRNLGTLTSDRHRAWVLCVTNAAVLNDPWVTVLLEKQRAAQAMMRDAFLGAEEETLVELKQSVQDPALPERTMDAFERDMSAAMMEPDWWHLAACLERNGAGFRRLWTALLDRVDDLEPARLAVVQEAVLDASLELFAGGEWPRA